MVRGQSWGSIMSSATRKAFSFLYVHLGQTSLWDRTKSQLDAVPREDEPIGATLAEHDHKREWYRVVIELEPGEDREDSIDRAEDLAKAELERRHPGYHVRS
jgi:hypothetical protein